MCGIAGISLSDRDARRNPAPALTAALLRGIEPRGRDATGIAWRANDQQIWLSKAAEPASTLADSLAAHTDGIRTVITHTRFATKGDPADNLNNHPIDHDGVVLTHNGTLSNDDDLFDVLGAPRYANVDSEAIAALLSWGPEVLGGDPWDLLPLIDGRAAVAWLRQDGPADTLRIARAIGSPLAVAQTVGGSFLYASTAEAITDAAEAAGLTIAFRRNLPEGTYLRIRHGRICDWLAFDLDDARTRIAARNQPRRRWDNYEGTLFPRTVGTR